MKIHLKHPFQIICVLFVTVIKANSLGTSVNCEASLFKCLNRCSGKMVNFAPPLYISGARRAYGVFPQGKINSSDRKRTEDFMNGKKMAARINSYLNSKWYRPSTMHEIAAKLKIPVKSRSTFFNIINKMRVSGQISIAQNGKIVSSSNNSSKKAEVLSAGPKGAFARLSDTGEDVFIFPENLCGAMPSDTVKVKIVRKTADRCQAVVMNVIERGFYEFTGIFHRTGKHAYVIPDSKYKGKISVNSRYTHNLKDGDMIFAKMTEYEKRGQSAKAEIIESYGPSGSARACCQAILDKFHARKVFPKEVVDQARKVSNKFEIDEKRLDLRDMPIFTIDGASAKDLDDAVSVERTETGYRLGVHIADVSHYVTAHSKLDEEALLRGTSIYYADSVIPMLPKELSNGICSLNPGKDRLAFSVFMEINEQGAAVSHKIAKSVIRSRVKGVYEEVNLIFDEKAGNDLLRKYKDVLPGLKIMRELAALLRKVRFARGAFDFESDESEFLIGEDGKINEIKRRERGEAEKMIEEFMLCANTAVATLAFDGKIPFVYRIHNEPELKKLTELAAALKAAGINAKAIRPGLKPMDIKNVLEEIKDSPKSKTLGNVILRSMSKARYSPECIGHFGLALKYYCHFTSPIRRYPDLAIHRILTDVLSADKEDLDLKYGSFVSEASSSSSAREISAMQIEWACEDAYKAEYMTSYIGSQFTGTVSSVKSFGMYVMLDNTVEGLVRMENMPGWYDFDEQDLVLRNKSSGKSFSIGDTVNVILASTDVPSGHIDFTLI